MESDKTGPELIDIDLDKKTQEYLYNIKKEKLGYRL